VLFASQRFLFKLKTNNQRSRPIDITVARWFVFKPKIPIWVNFGGYCNRKSWYILWPFGLFYGHWKYFMAIWYILWSFGLFLPVLIWQP
jgi:hypothetical protein